MKLMLILLIGLFVFSLEGVAGTAVWGLPNHGLVSHLETSGTEFMVGRPISILYTVRNITNKPLRIWHSGFWPNHQIRVCDPKGNLMELTKLGKEKFNAFSPGGERNKNFPVDVAPGGQDSSDGGMQDLTQLYDLKSPGIYSIQAVYEEYQGGWEGQLWSNVIIIQILAL